MPNRPRHRQNSAKLPLKLNSAILNIAAYRFVGIHDREQLREQWLEQCLALGMKGTILIAPEGINLFLAAPAFAIESWLNRLQADQRFAGLESEVQLVGTSAFFTSASSLKKRNHSYESADDCAL
jgi:UPF0176 protein